MAKEKKEKKEKEEKKKEKKEKKGKKEKKEKEEKPKKEKKGKKDKKEKKEKPKKEKKKKGKKGEPEAQDTPEASEASEGKKKKAKKKGTEKASSSSKESAEGAAEGAEAEEEQFPRSLSWAMLHILAMGFMLCDSLWTAVFPAADWLTCLGRMAYPIFAFLLVEGFFHTKNLWWYLLRLLGVAVVSEIPFNLFYGGSAVYPFHQNVIWTFVIGLLFLILLEEFKERFGQLPMLLFLPVPAFLGYFLGQVLLTDYYGAGVLIILVFYLFHGKHWGCLLGQLVCLWIINLVMMGGYYYVVPFLGYDFEMIQQSFALFALIPIWMYYGRQGLHGKVFRWFCYLFYPAHMLVLMIIRLKLIH